MVLIVEDNDDVREHVSQNLENDFMIKQAVHGKEGWDMASAYIPDLIICDIMMPEMDGIELCKRQKSDECTSHIQVILLTAKADVENKITGLETGADDYITKPFNMQELMVKANNLIEQRKNLREKFGVLPSFWIKTIP